MSEEATVDLSNVEIFSTGTWEGNGSAKGGDVITESTLDKWVETFKKIGSKVKPRLRLGHNSKQSESVTGLASLGWITDMKRNGNKLFADFKQVPKGIKKLMDNKQLGRFSPGVWGKMNVNGQDFEGVVDHVAILGADLPANMDLDGFIDNLYEHTESGEELRIYQNKIITEGKDMENTISYEKEFKDSLNKITEFEKQIVAKDEEIKTYQGKIVDLEKTIEETAYSALSEKADAFLEEAVKSGKIMPAQKPEYMAIAVNSETRSYEKDGKTIEADGLELVKSILENHPGKEYGKTESEAHEIKDNESDSNNANDGDSIDAEVKAYMKENDVKEYADAYQAVADQKREV